MLPFLDGKVLERQELRAAALLIVQTSIAPEFSDIPFALTLAERIATGDPRPSLVERYINHAGYVAAVTQAANNAFAQGYLLASDRDALIAAATASSVLN